MADTRVPGYPSYPIEQDMRGGNFGSLVFLALILLASFGSAGIASAVYAAVLLVKLAISRLKVERGVLRMVVPFFLLLILGAIGSRNHPLLDSLKDVWYLTKVVLAIGVGYALMPYVKSIRQILRLVIVAGVIAAIVHLVSVALSYQSGFSLMDIRNEAGGGYFVTVVGLGLLVGITGARQFLGLRKAFFWPAFVLSVASLILSASRTDTVSLVCLLVILRGWGRFDRRLVLRLLFLGALIPVLFAFAASEGERDELSFVGKLARSATEMSVRDYADMEDINLNWRGFESYRAYLAYLDGSSFDKIFGQGLGAMVDLGFYMPLGGVDAEPRRYIPVLHNGYMYVLVKYGMLGLLIYLYFLFSLVRFAIREPSGRPTEYILARRVLASLGWVFVFSTMVIAGLFNKFVLDASLIILGAVVAYIDRYGSQDFRVVPPLRKISKWSF